ncbi:hypothetical protein FXO38_35025 [Capsicum annuum]|nr:hypothetical protein FXO38_35025 [Capsicum annuum]KAF3618944.1 hypothetical protein FXO37_33953 [Capsicum annuum]
MGLNSEQNDGWEVYARKPKNKGGKRAEKECSSQEYFPPTADYDKAGENDVEDNELDFIDESDDDLQYDDFDSDVTETSYEMRKKNRWFKQLLESRDSLTITEINDSKRQWHCPAWKVGQGKSRLKFELRSYKGTVWNSAKQMRDDNQHLIWFKNKAKALEECLSLMESQEQYFKDQIKMIYDVRTQGRI